MDGPSAGVTPAVAGGLTKPKISTPRACFIASAEAS
jgi:hypothetical protein